MIKELILFTNGVVMAIDENDCQVSDIQADLNTNQEIGYRRKDALDKVIKDKPNIKIAKWSIWSHDLSLAEFAYLIGLGEYYKKSLEEKENIEGGD